MGVDFGRAADGFEAALAEEEGRFAATFFAAAVFFATVFLGADDFLIVFLAVVLVAAARFFAGVARLTAVFAVFFGGRFLAETFLEATDFRFVATFRFVLPDARFAMVPPEENHTEAITEFRRRLVSAEDINRHLLTRAGSQIPAAVWLLGIR